MPRICQLTGKRTASGNRVSHANNKNKRVFRVNIAWRRFWVASQKRWVSLRVSQAGLRTIDKIGVEAALARIEQGKL